MPLPIIFIGLALLPTTALAYDGPFFSLANAHFIEVLAFSLLVATLWHQGVFGYILCALDNRADAIRTETEIARALHDQAQIEFRTQQTRLEAAQKCFPEATQKIRADCAEITCDLREDLQCILIDAFGP